MSRLKRAGVFAAMALLLFVTRNGIASSIPELQSRGTTTQLLVDGKPFLMLAGELGNSTASSLQDTRDIWPRLAQLNLNTVLAPVYWEHIEPREGRFDFRLLDGLIVQARRSRMKLVLLWFGSWKNSMSCYVPAWVKTDPDRFPRSRLQSGRAVEALTPFSSANMEADRRAFVALMRHLKEVDENERTVLMVQVENEIGMLTDARDYGPLANEAFEQPVPESLMDYLAAYAGELDPELCDAWRAGGARGKGSWQQVFGDGLATDERFMAWYYAAYVEQVASAGKAEYNLPMFVNAALIRPGYRPGQYPGAGPLPHLIDIWRAAAPSIDFFAPDIYFPNFAHWCGQYARAGNPLFIPEASNDPNAAVRAFYAIGAYNAMGFSPFAVEDISETSPLGKAYDILTQLTPLILQKQDQDQIAGVLLDRANPVSTITLGDYRLTVSHDYTWSCSGGADASFWPAAGGLIVHLGENEFLFAGSGIIVTFAPEQGQSRSAGIVTIQEGRFVRGQWQPDRTLNGDQSHQGRHLRIPMHAFKIQRITLYQYQ